MPFSPKETKKKVKRKYKTLYISEKLISDVDHVAKKHNTSWNNVVISMIEYCLEDEKRDP